MLGSKCLGLDTGALKRWAPVARLEAFLGKLGLICLVYEGLFVNLFGKQFVRGLIEH